MDQPLFLNSLKYVFRISHTEEGWISPFLDSVNDVDFDMARWKPSEDVASIWEIVAHAIPYTQSRLADFSGDAFPDEEDWPVLEDQTPQAWAVMQDRVRSVVSRLQEVVDGLSEEELSTPRPGGKTPRVERLMDIVVHDAYHAGQIVKLSQVFQAIGRPKQLA